jgi:putative oxidoreductase
MRPPPKERKNMTELMIWTGRAAIGSLFVFGGLTHLGSMAEVSDQMSRNGIPFARPLLIAGTAFQICAGLLLIVGIFVSGAALGLIAFTIAASAMVLRFWELPDGPPRHAARNALLSNIGVAGGLLLAFAGNH